jgi:hypothetical protein
MKFMYFFFMSSVKGLLEQKSSLNVSFVNIDKLQAIRVSRA